jgi:Xaa-Pro dipeptidase
MDIESIQQYLGEHDLDAWLLADFHGRNDVAMDVLGLTGMLTRRAFYLIPAVGEPVALVNPIEASRFRNLPGRIISYEGYRGLESHLAGLLDGLGRVAMEYSPKGRLPYIGLVDAGTLELVRASGATVVSSADLVAHFQARLDPPQIATHRMAAHNLIEIKEAVFAHIAESLKAGRTLTEFDVCEFMRDRFKEYDMVTSDGPVCAVDAHAGDPHFEPQPESPSPIAKGSLVLIDLWAKAAVDRAVYGDITWVAYAGSQSQIPERFTEMFGIIVRARDAAVEFLREHVGKRPVYGYEVDDACRGVVAQAGYGRYFTHRTGHSITTAIHGPGPNIDNLETEDRRKLQPGHLFSIEPGIYRDDCGFRTEIDCLITEEGPEVTALPLQTEIVPLL